MPSDTTNKEPIHELAKRLWLVCHAKSISPRERILLEYIQWLEADVVRIRTAMVHLESKTESNGIRHVMAEALAYEARSVAWLNPKQRRKSLGKLPPPQRQRPRNYAAAKAVYSKQLYK